MDIKGRVRLEKNFILSEFACRCCGEVAIPNHRLHQIAQDVRDHFGVPMRVVGYRCEEHNKEVGGAEKSLHLTGEAVDISPIGHNVLIPHIYDLLKRYDEIKGLGIYDGHVHYDCRMTDKRVTWDNRTRPGSFTLKSINET